MPENVILDFSFSQENISKVFEYINARRGGGIVALRIKNFLAIKSVASDNELKDILDRVKTVFAKYLVKHQLNTNPQIFVALPFFFASIDNVGEDFEHKMQELEHSMNLINFHYFDTQFTMSYAAIKEINPENNAKLIRNLVGILGHDNKLSGIIKYEDDLTSITRQEYGLLSRLKYSIRNNMVKFAYQPIIDCRSGDVAYYECLLRIPDDEGELISAGRSIILAEKYGIIHYVDKIVIEMAAKELLAAPELKLAVNISNIGLLDYRLVQAMKQHLSQKSIASRLTIEITETAVNDDLDKTLQFVDFARKLGCKIAIDDFGAGSSSIRQLKNIKFDVLKIDGSLIKDVVENEYSRFLVEMLVKIAAEVGAKTVAEYVEDGTIAKFLLDLNVDFMQGNYFSPAKNFRTWSNKDAV